MNFVCCDYCNIVITHKHDGHAGLTFSHSNNLFQVVLLDDLSLVETAYNCEHDPCYQ